MKVKVMITLTPMKTSNPFAPSRRMFMFGAVASVAAGPVFALTKSEATKLVDGVVADINRTIGSGKSEADMIKDFEKILVKYADVSTIARSALGPAARSASSSDMSAYTKAFQGYIARKYGKRFREFEGGKITVKSTKSRGKFFEVGSQVRLPGKSPFEVTFRVSDRSGMDLFFDIIIEGISLLSTERAEMGSLLDKNRGSVSKTANALKSLG